MFFDAAACRGFLAVVPVDDEVADGVKALRSSALSVAQATLCVLSVVQGLAVGKFNRMLKQAVVSLWLCLTPAHTKALEHMQFCENKCMLKSMTSQFQRTFLMFT